MMTTMPTLPSRLWRIGAGVLALASAVGCAAPTSDPTMRNMTRLLKGQAPSMASMSQAQETAMTAALEAGRPADGAVASLAQAAKPRLTQFLRVVSCLTTYDPGALSGFANPGRGALYVTPPATRTKYHDKRSCMTVEAVGPWKQPARNALQVDVKYTAPDSGESIKVSHELIAGQGGRWFFTR